MSSSHNSFSLKTENPAPEVLSRTAALNSALRLQECQDELLLWLDTVHPQDWTRYRQIR